MKRRYFLPVAGAASVAFMSYEARREPLLEQLPDGPPGNSAVAILRANSYSEDLVPKILEGIHAVGLKVRGKRVLLKPNLVEFDAATVINTDVRMVAAVFEAFRALGAAEVRIGEGPGHRRDTFGLAEQAGYFSAIRNFESHFTDLNRDDVALVKGFASEREMFFPQAALGADLIVSLPKLKTHHLAGITASMKNLFGLVPGAVYGWPKNKLHYIGIEQSIVALSRQFPNTFAIVDGVVGMEGNGPIQGTPKCSGVLVMGRDLVAVDATCCRIMGIDPEKIPFLRLGATLGHVHTARIEQRGEAINAVRSDFELLNEFSGLRLKLSA